MNFFVPDAPRGAGAERVCAAIRAELEEQGFPTGPRRIWRLAFRELGLDRRIDVGCVVPELGEPALLILRAADRPVYYVCTLNWGMMTGEPFMVADDLYTCTVDFDPPPRDFEN